MAVYQMKKVVGDVRVLLNENMSGEVLEGLGDVDTLSLDELIAFKVVDGVNRVHATAPIRLLENGHNFGDGVYWADEHSGWVLLPADFMRLIVFEMDDWSRGVFSAIDEEDVHYPIQHSRWRGVRGTTEHPVCAVVWSSEGRVLEFYSCRSRAATVKRAVYVPYAQVVNGGVEISKRCYTAVLYVVAGLTLESLAEKERAGRMFEQSKGSLV